MPKGIPASGKRRKRGPQKKYASPVKKRAAVKLKPRAKAAVKRKAPVTRTSAKSVVLDQFSGLDKKLMFVTGEVAFVRQVFRANLLDAWRNHSLAGGDLVDFTAKWECSMLALSITEADLQEHLSLFEEPKDKEPYSMEGGTPSPEPAEDPTAAFNAL